MSDLEIRNRISEKAREYFLRFGFSKVTMNEIATELGMSKKTLYTYFPSKEELLHASVQQMQEETSRQIERLIADKTLEFSEKLNRLLQIVLTHHSKFDGRFLADLQKNVPDTWKFCNDFQRERMQNNTTAIVREGIEKGLFRKDLQENFLVLLFIGSMQQMMQPETLSQVPFTRAQVFELIMDVFLSGILTEEGKARLLSPSALGGVENSEHQMD
ncbi:MAG: TetR/AcrR family transcriptional regulator [Bacteroidota bacterium]